MIVPCALALKQCLPCNDDPIRNITAEAPDVDVFIGYRDFKWNPPLGVTYFQLACKSICFSEVSQEEANLCALRDAQECDWDGGSPPGPPVPPGPNGTGGKGGGPNLPPQRPRTPIRRYRNKVQTCDAKCPDGSTFTETVPAGTIVELSQALADAKAKSLACKLAQRNLFCISATPPPSACVGEDYFFIVTSNNGTDLIWSIDGSLPPGLFFDFLDATIIGTPTVSGSYTFIVEVTDSLGRSQSKVLTICIMEIVTPATLPDAEVGLVYAIPLVQQPATVSSEVWTLVSGNLPDGILLAPSGSLTGIPTTNGISNFTLKVDAVCEGQAVSCQKAFTLEVGGCNCGSGSGSCNLDFSPFSWNNFFVFADPATPSTGTGTAVGNTVEFDIHAIDGLIIGSCAVSVEFPPLSPFIITDTVNCSFKLKVNAVEFSESGGASSFGFGIDILQDGVVIFRLRHSSANVQGAFPDLGPAISIGCNEYDIPLVAAINSQIEIRGNVVDDPSAYAHASGQGPGLGGSARVSVSFKLCNT